VARTLLISGHFGGPDHERKLRFFERVSATLERSALAPLVLDLSPASVRSSLPGLSLPTFVRAGHRLPVERHLVGTAISGLSPRFLEAAAIDEASLACNASAARLRAFFLRRYFEEVLDRTRPALCLLWHQFNAPHTLLAELCEERKLPVVFAEYGLLPGTVAFDARGQMAESWVAAESPRFCALPVDGDDLDRARSYLERVAREGRNRKPQQARAAVTQALLARRREGRTMVFYAGQNDAGAGMIPRDSTRARLHSPLYRSTEDGLAHLADLAGRNDWRVLFKPHPMASPPPALAPAQPVDVLTGADLSTCMDASACTVTILSQVAYQALIRGHPCVLLGRSPLSGKRCAYEVATRDDAEETIRRAIAKGFTDAQREAWLLHVAQLCRYQLFAFDEDLGSAVGRGAEQAALDLVERLEAWPTPRASTRPVPAAQSAPLRVRAAYRVLRMLSTPRITDPRTPGPGDAPAPRGRARVAPSAATPSCAGAAGHGRAPAAGAETAPSGSPSKRRAAPPGL